MTKRSLAYKDIFTDTLLVQVTCDSLMLCQLYLFRKRIEQTLKTRRLDDDLDDGMTEDDLKKMIPHDLNDEDCV